MYGTLAAPDRLYRARSVANGFPYRGIHGLMHGAVFDNLPLDYYVIRRDNYSREACTTLLGYDPETLRFYDRAYAVHLVNEDLTAGEVEALRELVAADERLGTLEVEEVEIPLVRSRGVLPTGAMGVGSGDGEISWTDAESGTQIVGHYYYRADDVVLRELTVTA